MSGHIRARAGADTWELRFEGPRVAGRRRTITTTFHGTRKAAAAELRRRMVQVDRGEHVEPSKLTVGAFVVERICQWQGEGKIAGRTTEHYEDLARLITAHLGATPLQRLTTRDIERWHGQMRADGRAPSTIRHAHGLLGHALTDALRHGLITRNVAHEQAPPRAPAGEIRLPTTDQIGPMLAALAGTEFRVPAIVTVNCGLRRSELLALRWADISWDAATVTIARALDETCAGGIRIKSPKTASGIRTISLPTAAVVALREHRREQLERRLFLGLGRPPESALVFPGHHDGQPQAPRPFSLRWLRTVRRLGLPPVTWHGLRHVHASLLLAVGIDIATVAKRLGHSGPHVTLKIYAHAIARDDRHAADALDRALGG